jgi:putative ABC transport system ATP-binding protein
MEGTTLLLVTHDATLAECANRRIVLRDGLIISDEMNEDRQTPAGTAAGV